MKIKRYSIFALLLILSLLVTACGGKVDSGAQTETKPEVEVKDDYPNKELNMILPIAAGGGVDRSARAIQRFLPEVIGVSVLAENRDGADGKIGIDYFNKQAKDGYNIMFFHQPGLTTVLGENPEMGKIDDYAIINVVDVDPILIAATKKHGWETFEDFVEGAKANPGKYSYGVPGATSAGALTTKYLFDMLGLEIKYVPYASGGEARTAVRGGHVDLTSGGAAGMLAIEDASVALAVINSEPFPAGVEWPETPPVNNYLEKQGLKMPNAAAYRFAAVHKEFKEQYPERWDILVNAFKEVITNHDGYKAFCVEGKLGSVWNGPEKSTEMVNECDEFFTNLLNEK